MPPVKSIDNLGPPFMNRLIKPKKINPIDKTVVNFILFKKLKLVLLNSLIYILNDFKILFFVSVIKKVLVIKIAQNIELNIPILNVTANPLIGPEPTPKSTAAAINVVKFASNIVLKARSYPDLIAPLTVLPLSSSSLILSKIITLASTVIPIVNINPAIPGSVRVAPKLTKTVRMNRMLTVSYTHLTLPTKST